MNTNAITWGRGTTMLKPLAVLLAAIVATLMLAAPSDAGTPVRTRAGWVEVIRCDWVSVYSVTCHTVWVHPGHGTHR